MQLENLLIKNNSPDMIRKRIKKIKKRIDNYKMEQKDTHAGYLCLK